MTVRTLLALVGIVALLCGVWSHWFDPVRQWRRALRDDNDGIRRWEAVADARSGKVSWLGDAEAIAELISALKDPSFRVRQSAASGLAGFGLKARPAVPALCGALNDPWKDVRVESAQGLGYILDGAPEEEAGPAVAALTGKLRDPSSRVRLAAAVALVKVGAPERAVPVMANVLGGADPIARLEAIYWLSKTEMGYPIVRPVLLRMVRGEFTGPDEALFRRNRLWAAGRLYEIGDRDLALSILADALGQDDPEMQREAVNVLASTAPEIDPQTLVPTGHGPMPAPSPFFRQLRDEARKRMAGRGPGK